MEGLLIAKKETHVSQYENGKEEELTSGMSPDLPLEHAQ
jgi:hypothetical protein